MIDIEYYVQTRQEEYQDRIVGQTCFNCANCERPDKGEPIGWCTAEKEFVYFTDTPEATECWSFL